MYNIYAKEKCIEIESGECAQDSRAYTSLARNYYYRWGTLETQSTVSDSYDRVRVLCLFTVENKSINMWPGIWKHQHFIQ